MTNLLADVRYAVRLLAKTPGFTAIAVLTLGLGIGANTAIFSVIDAVLLRPLPYPEPTRLVAVWEAGLTGAGGTADSVAPPNFLDWREQSTVFDGLAALTTRSVNLSGRGDPERLDGLRVTAEFFDVLGVSPMLGRTFETGEDREGDPPVVVLSHGLWMRRYGADPALVGDTVTLDGTPHTVLGVMPRGFFFRDRTVEAWLPMAFTERDRTQRGAHFITVIGRLARTSTLAGARAEMTTIAARLEAAYPRFNTGLGATVMPLHESVVGGLRPTLLILLGAVGFVLLIACTNLANMLLARATLRERELAVRRALGAGRRRVVRQLLVESTALALLGGAAGVLLAVWGLDALLALSPDDIARLDDTVIDGRVLLFTAVVSLGTGVLFGLLPALQLSSHDVTRGLREGGRGAVGTSGSRLRTALTAVEVALAVILLVGAALMINSFMRLQRVDPGFDPESVLTLRVDLAGERYAGGAQRLAFYRDMLERVEALPGVRRSGMVTMLPLGGNGITLGITIEGAPVASDEQSPRDMKFSSFRVVTPGYFESMGIPIVRGRDVSERDTDAGPGVAVISEAMARTYWPGDDPLGRRFKLGRSPDTPWKEVVGVVGDVRQSELRDEPAPAMYVPASQSHPTFAAPRMLTIDVAGDPMAIAPAVRQVIQAIDPNQPVSRVRRLSAIVSESVSQPRFYAALLGAFGIVALLLAALGVYGVIAYSVGQRAHEIGLRLALGAERRDILRMVLGQGIGVTTVGLLLGLAGAALLARLLSSLLFGVTVTDPVSFLTASAVLAAVALVACYVPARRAMQLDPMVTLRTE